jgi:hypothetical protein
MEASGKQRLLFDGCGPKIFLGYPRLGQSCHSRFAGNGTTTALVKQTTMSNGEHEQSFSEGGGEPPFTATDQAVAMGLDDLSNDGAQQQPIKLNATELYTLCSERHVLQLTPEEDELLDPIERTVRYLVPIPKQYYWEIQGTSPWSWSGTSEVPLPIRMWHQTIAICDTVGTIANNYIAQPLAGMMGLTGPRFFEVIDSMTKEEMEESARRVRARAEEDRVLRQQRQQPPV